MIQPGNPDVMKTSGNPGKSEAIGYAGSVAEVSTRDARERPIPRCRRPDKPKPCRGFRSVR
jgi:hypothetical protein